MTGFEEFLAGKPVVHYPSGFGVVSFVKPAGRDRWMLYHSEKWPETIIRCYMNRAQLAIMWEQMHRERRR